ncbi:MAG: ABC transporter ATP-binding protein [Chloroflexi bacterium]|nr:MAG: ABC transporter ATP-binding protein [Chloroflexota bacterium]MBL1193087.1 ABC transporter ATP-binding protein [Chloroflexota bacterium]NOH10380.1 ABC transporter ATP-binding protein [Chloroflexota bacterium]
MPRTFRNSLDLIFNYVRPYWKQVAVLVVFFGVVSLIVAMQPLVMAPILDIALGESSFEPRTPDSQPPVTLTDLDLNNVDQFVAYYLNLGSMDAWTIVLLLAAIYFSLSLIQAVIEFVSFQLTVRVRVRAFRDLQRDLFKHLMSLSFDFFNYQKTGEILSRLEKDTQGSVKSLAEAIRTLIVSPTMIFFYGFMLVRTNLRLTLLVTVIATVQWFIARLLSGAVRQRVIDQFDVFAEASAYLQEVFQNIRVVKSFVAERFEVTRFEELIERMLPIHFRFAIYKHLQEPLTVVVNGLANVTILLLATWELFQGTLTIEGFVLFLYLGRAIILPITQLAQVYLEIQTMMASAERVEGLFQLPSSITSGAEMVVNLKDAIQLSNVGFSYEDEPVLQNVNVEIKRGQVVALVGPSGAGKSTMTDLLMRFYDPTEGKITLDGINLKELDVKSYRSLFGVVAQENLLFNAPIEDNITYGRDGITQENIREAALVANADEFIRELPKGYETLVGDRGIRVSGGQRQRIAIARAIVHRPPILILDEATSALDTESERQVQAAIDRVIEDTTAIVIAHRLSTVIHADKIVVLEAGKVVDQGKHEELLGRCALYQHLVELQFHLNGSDEISETEKLEESTE